MHRVAIAAVVLAAAGSPTLAQNLLVNGDFEQGSLGWTEWNGGWGGPFYYNYSDQEPGNGGGYNLHMYAGSGSFGVYQEVHGLTPGQEYEVFALWKADAQFNPNATYWFEILLIDGPFSVQQADQPGTVEQNFMYAFDPATYGFDWTPTSDFNGQNPPDYWLRSGKRTASGDTMTVVLKCGGYGSNTFVQSWFDPAVLLVRRRGAARAK